MEAKLVNAHPAVRIRLKATTEEVEKVVHVVWEGLGLRFLGLETDRQEGQEMVLKRKRGSANITPSKGRPTQHMYTRIFETHIAGSGTLSGPTRRHCTRVVRPNVHLPVHIFDVLGKLLLVPVVLYVLEGWDALF